MGWAHQCRRPPIWWARLIGKRDGATWRCHCGQDWRLVADYRTHGVPGVTGPFYSWEEA